MTFYQITLDGEWDLSDRLTTTALVGYSRSELDSFEDKFYNELFAGVILDYEGDARFNPRNQYAVDVDPTDPSIWRAHEIDLRDTNRENEFYNAKIDFAYELNDEVTASAGFNFKQFQNDGSRATAGNLLRSDWQNGVVDDDVSQIAYVVTESDAQEWIGVDPAEGLAFFGIERDTGDGDQNEIFSIKENIFAGYAQFDIDTHLGGTPVRANMGVRYVSLDRTNEGVFLTDDSTNPPRLVESSRDDFLPSFNVAADVTDDIVLRFAYSANLTRAPLGQLSPNLTIRTTNFQDVRTGNPDLEPFLSDNIDVYAEKYFGDIGYVSLGFFYKDVRNFITTAAQDVPFSDLNQLVGLDIPTSLLEPGQDENTIFTFSQPVNSQDASIKGIEAAFQAELGFISDALSNVGVIGNYTYADGSLDFVNLDGSEVVTADFPGLSNHSANGTVYYETERWGRTRIGGLPQRLHHDRGSRPFRRRLSRRVVDSLRGRLRVLSNHGSDQDLHRGLEPDQRNRAALLRLLAAFAGTSPQRRHPVRGRQLAVLISSPPKREAYERSPARHTPGAFLLHCNQARPTLTFGSKSASGAMMRLAAIGFIAFVLFGLLLGGRVAAEEQPSFRFGIIADCQYADRDNSSVRHYRAAAQKLREAVADLNTHELAFVAHLGDFIDKDWSSFDVLEPIAEELTHDWRHVLGNHDYSVADEFKPLVHGTPRPVGAILHF